jgi:hypothetical protein
VSTRGVHEPPSEGWPDRQSIRLPCVTLIILLLSQWYSYVAFEANFSADASDPGLGAPVARLWWLLFDNRGLDRD